LTTWEKRKAEIGKAETQTGISARYLNLPLHTPFHHARSIADFTYAEKLTVMFSVEVVMEEGFLA
jgi:hypothetical protein